MNNEKGQMNSASCPIIYDLLPLYIDSACSEETKRLVEGHLAGCAACKRKFEAMAGELGMLAAADGIGVSLLPEQAEPQDRQDRQGQQAWEAQQDRQDQQAWQGQQDQQARDRAARQILRRVKRRWQVSLLACLLLVPLGWLGVNEYTGNGLAYTNMVDYYYVGKFGSALERGDYEQAFSYLDIAYYYNSIQHDKEYARTATVDRADFQFVAYEDGREEYTNGEFNVPAADFEQWLRDAEQGVADLQAYYASSPYADMTYSQFYETSKRNFIANMEQWAERGYAFEGVGIGHSYDHYSYVYRFHLANGTSARESGTLTVTGRGKGKFYIIAASHKPDEMAVEGFISHLMIWPREEE